MGCVWQSEYAPEPRRGDAKGYHRAPARHRKPSVWRRAGRSVRPLLAATSAIGRPRVHLGRLSLLARWR